MKTIVILLVLLTYALQMDAQVKNKGIPLIINHFKKEYQAGAQNWCIAQDNRGFIYFANLEGLLEYDGVKWNKHNVRDLRSVAVDDKGAVYVGGFNEIGYFHPGANGRMEYESISAKFPLLVENLKEVWKVHVTSEGVYFQSKTKILLYRKKQLEVILPTRGFYFSFYVNNTLYVFEPGVGLEIVDGTRLVKVEGSDFFANKSIESILPLSSSKIIICTPKDGLFLYDGKTFTPWSPQTYSFLKENVIFCATSISNDFFAVGTIRNGLLIIDKNGRPIQHINQHKGLQNNTVLSLFSDRNSNLWVGLDKGIDFVNINSPISYYNEGFSLAGTGYAALVEHEKLYIGTNQGLFVKKWTDYEDPLKNDENFTIVPQSQGQVWFIDKIDNAVFCGHNNGAFTVNGDKVDFLSDVPGAWMFIKSDRFPGLIISGNYEGLVLYEKKGNNWVQKKKVAGYAESSRFLAEDRNGNIWATHWIKGAIKINLDPYTMDASKVRCYTQFDGIGSVTVNSVNTINGQTVFCTSKGAYNYLADKDRFEVNNEINSSIGAGELSRLYEDKLGNIWFVKSDEIGIIHHSIGYGAKNVERYPFYPIVNKLNKGYEDIFFCSEKDVVFSCEEGVIHYDLTMPVKTPEKLKCFIRSVYCKNEADSLVFAGALPAQSATEPLPRMKYSYNNIRFNFAAPFYDCPDQIRYSYLLKGFDENWSTWQSSSDKEYTNLREGKYTFYVKARNVYGTESDVATFVFEVSPPWFRSFFAYVFYFFLSLAISLLIFRLYRIRVEQERIILEKKQQDELLKQEQAFTAETLENEKKMIGLEKEKLEASMEHKNKELANSTMNLIKKNELLMDLKDNITKLMANVKDKPVVDKLKSVVAHLDQNIETDNDWETFESHFDAVHENFLKTLKKKYPLLSPKDMKLCAYLRMNLSTKEIAPLLNISPRGVEISRYRLRKKLNIDRDQNLTEFMLDI